MLLPDALAYSVGWLFGRLCWLMRCACAVLRGVRIQYGRAGDQSRGKYDHAMISVRPVHFCNFNSSHVIIIVIMFEYGKSGRRPRAQRPSPQAACEINVAYYASQGVDRRPYTHTYKGHVVDSLCAPSKFPTERLRPQHAVAHSVRLIRT